MKINRQLAKQAKEKGICKDWFKDLEQTENITDLIQMYLKGIDFCLANDFPSNDFIRKHFKGKMEDFGIFLDGSFQLKNKSKCVLLGNCKGILAIDQYNVSEVFVKHQSEIILEAKDNAFVMIDLFDDAVLHIHALGDAKICVNQYQGKSQIHQTKSENAQIKIITKNKKTY